MRCKSAASGSVPGVDGGAGAAGAPCFGAVPAGYVGNIGFLFLTLRLQSGYRPFYPFLLGAFPVPREAIMGPPIMRLDGVETSRK